MGIQYATIRLIIIASVPLLVTIQAGHSWACGQSHGRSSNDKQIAQRICEGYQNVPEILMMSVQETILYVDINETLYRGFLGDRVLGKKVVRDMLRIMQELTGRSVVTVWVYWDKAKVIEGQVVGGNLKVTFL